MTDGSSHSHISPNVLPGGTAPGDEQEAFDVIAGIRSYLIGLLLALAFGILIVMLLVFGSLWIMAHLNRNMPSMEEVMKMQR